MTLPASARINRIHNLLSAHFGPLHWWPAETPFEVVIGAILTQNTAWTNVEKAITNLKEARLLTPQSIADTAIWKLEDLIRPSGFFRQKALRLRHLASHLVEDWHGDLDKLCGGALDRARSRLLALPGVGPETADSILLYAAGRPSFVVDAYTRRIFERVGILAGSEGYEAIRTLFMASLAEDVALYNEYHAQIVELAKGFCRKKNPLCSKCPIKKECDYPDP